MGGVNYVAAAAAAVGDDGEDDGEIQVDELRRNADHSSCNTVSLSMTALTGVLTDGRY